MAIDYEVEYNNRARVPEHPEIFARWQREAAAYRDETTNEGRAEIGLKYGPSPRQTIDLFKPKGGGNGPLALFIHGGYWRSLEPASFSQTARGMNAHGVTVAVSGYDLVAAGEHRPDHRADPGGLSHSLEEARQAHHGQRPFGRRASRRLHDRDRLEDARRERAGRSRARGLCDLRHLRPRAAAASRNQHRLQARRRRGAAHLAAVLERRTRPRARRGGRRRRIVGIPAAQQAHRRRLARQGRGDALRGRCPG